MANFPHYIQPNLMDCGATCLRIISKYYGREFPVSFLRERSFTGRQGASLLGISKAAEDIGFHTMGVRINFETLKEKATLPLIALWQQHHYIVVYKIDDKRVYVSDPANSLLTYTHEEFIKYWIGKNATPKTEEGICLLLEPSPDFNKKEISGIKQEKSKRSDFLLHYAKPHQKLMLQVLLVLVAGTLMQTAVPFLTQSIVDTGINKKDFNYIWLVLGAQLMLTLGQMVLELMRGWMMLYISSRINITLVSDFFIKLMKLPIRYFDTRLTGDLMQRIQDQTRIERFLTETLLSGLSAIFTLVTCSFILAYYNITLFILFLIGSVLYVGWILFFLKRREKLDYKRFQEAGDNNSKIMELIYGMQEIKMHNAEQQKRWAWERIQVKLYHISIKSLNLEQQQNVGSRIINEVKNLLTAVIAAKLVMEGEMTLGMMMSVMFIIGQMNGPVAQMIGIVKGVQDAKISLDRITEIYEKEDENVLHTKDANRVEHKSFLPIPSDNSFYLKNVSFRYDGLSKDVLKDINLVIPAGKVTAIVGPSGSGKSTLLKLLMRFYVPATGEILMDKTDINQTDIYQWRNLCGVVLQDGFLFSDTIAGNIAVGEENPDMDKLKHAAQVANIQTFIDSLPLEYNTKIGQEGTGISGGQKQRLQIARAVYKNPSVLFFDEATSALDAKNEKEIMEHLKEFYVGKTVVVMAHRLSTVKDADNIVVLDQGSIKEEGTHEELLAKKGFYYELVKNQLEIPE